MLRGRLRLCRPKSLVMACVFAAIASITQAQEATGTSSLPPSVPLRNATPPRRSSPPLNTTQPLKLSDKEDRYLYERVDPERTLDVLVGRPTLLRFRTPFFRDQIADPDIADTLSITENELSVTGKTVGTTVLNLWFNDPAAGQEEILSYLVRVSEDPERSRQYDLLLENLERDINRGFPNSVVDLSYVGSQVVVRGKAKDVEDATHILRIVSQSLPTDEQVDQSTSILPVENQNAPITSVFPPSNAQSLQGFTVDEIVDAGGFESIFEGQTTTGANTVQINNRVINMLEIAGVHQVMLKVTLAEVVRDSGRSLISEARFGVDSDTGDDISFTQQTGIGRLTFQTNQFFLRFDALKRLGLARSLSEPNLTTLSGQPANFLVGGQFPILESVSTVAAVNQNIRFVPFGVQLTVLPTVTDGDRIRLQLQATISETSNGQGQGQGQVGTNNPAEPPSLSTRTFTSTVELRDTESLALAGLIRNSLTNSSTRVPFLGDLPVVGNLFSQNTSTFQEQELIVVVTPYLVTPVPSEMTPALPGSDLFEADDIEFYLRGDLTGTIAEDYRSPVRDTPSRIHTFRQVEQKYIIGMPGHSSGRPLPNCASPNAQKGRR